MNPIFKENGIIFRIDKNTNLNTLFDYFISSFSYKAHKYIHIIEKESICNEEFLTFIKKLKQKSILIIFEPKNIENTDYLKNLYAVGIDFFVLNKNILKNSELIHEISSTLPTDIIVLKDDEENIIKNKNILEKMPFLIEDSIFEPIKRKIWIDITNLRRKLRIKEVSESYNSSGL